MARTEHFVVPVRIQTSLNDETLCATVPHGVLRGMPYNVVKATLGYIAKVPSNRSVCCLIQPCNMDFDTSVMGGLPNCKAAVPSGIPRPPCNLDFHSSVMGGLPNCKVQRMMSHLPCNLDVDQLKFSYSLVHLDIHHVVPIFIILYQSGPS